MFSKATERYEQNVFSKEQEAIQNEQKLCVKNHFKII